MIYFKTSAILRILCFVLAILFPCVCFGDAERMFRENNPAVVLVSSLDREGKPMSIGSGFAVREDGVIVTNCHAINITDDIKVKMGTE